MQEMKDSKEHLGLFPKSKNSYSTSISLEITNGIFSVPMDAGTVSPNL